MKKQDFLFLSCLVFSAFKFLHAIETVVDVEIYDETVSYLTPAVRHTFHSFAFGPLYSAWLYVLSLFEKDNLALYYLNVKFLTFLTVLILYALLRTLGARPWISAAASALFLASGSMVTPSNVSVFAFIAAMTTLVAALRAKRALTAYLIFASGVLVLTFIRVEYLISLFISCGILAAVFVKSLKDKKKSRAQQTAVVFFFLVVGTMVLNMWADFSADHSWPTYLTAYSHRYYIWHKVDLSSQYVHEHVFTNARSIAGAFFCNPVAFFGHALRNLAAYPRVSLGILLVSYWGKMAKVAEILVLLGFGPFAVERVLAHRRTLWDAVPKRPLKMLAILAFPSVFASIFVYPRAHYLFMQSLVILSLTAVMTNAYLERIKKMKDVRPPAALALGALILLAAPVRAASPDKTFPQNQAAIRFIRQLDIKKEIIFLPGYHVCWDVYLPKNFRQVFHLDLKETYRKRETVEKQRSEENFKMYLKKNDIGMVLADEDLKHDLRFGPDPEFQDFLLHSETSGFKKVQIPDTPLVLFLRNDYA